MLNIRLLGEFRLALNSDQVKTVSTNRLQSLLAYLILHQDAPQPRQRIAALLWPDSDEAQARTNLRNLLHLLRQSLPEADHHLVIERAVIQWKSDVEDVLDVGKLERAAQDGEFEAVVTLYAGDLLPDCYDEWVIEKREELRQVYTEALRQLISQRECEHDFRGAAVYANRLVRHEPLQEQAYRDLMRLSALGGDQTGILRAYKACTTVLRNELGISPSEATREIYHTCLKQRFLTGAAERPVSFALPEHATNLPHQSTAFIGREREKTKVRDFVEAHHLVTLSGAGGVGKTRLALAVAEELLDKFADGVWYVELTSLSERSQVIQAVASVLGVYENNEGPLISRLTDFLSKKHLLLLLDNCENVVEAVRFLAETILHTVPSTWLLVTSRIVLNLREEVVWRVPPLSFPEMSPDDFIGNSPIARTVDDQHLARLRDSESGLFFTDRARAVLPTFVITNENAWYIGKICQQLDGIPLALELAAARIKLLTVQQITEHLDHALKLLAHGSSTALPHHQTMQATMEWSHLRLTKPEQTLFRRLSIFAGGATLEAIEKTCSENGLEASQILDLLSDLIDKSLVAVEHADETIRYRLHEITRQYAHLELEKADELAVLSNCHLEYFCALIEAMAPDFLDRKSAEFIRRQMKEHKNVQAALEWSTHEPGSAHLGLRLATASISFWEDRGLAADGRNWLEKLLALVADSGEPTIRARALTATGRAAYILGDFDQACSRFEQSLALANQANNPTAIMADNYLRLAVVVGSQEKFDVAKPMLEKSLELFRSINHQGGVADVLSIIGYLHFRLGDFISARSVLEECLAIYRTLNLEYPETRAKLYLGRLALVEKDYTRAHSLFCEAINSLLKIGSLWGVIYILGAFVCLHAARQQYKKSAKLFGAMENLSVKMGALMAKPERIDVERSASLAQAAIGEQAFHAAWAEGRAMTLEQTVQYALETAP